MLPDLNKIKGVHPGAILRRELKIRNLKSNELARDIGEYKQTISAIINKRRDINPILSIKLSKQFNVAKDYFMLVQSSYDVKKAIDSEQKRIPNLNIIREILFWDTTIDKIDWNKNKKAVIKRVLERGNNIEINEFITFYGRTTVAKLVKSIGKSYLSTFEKNAIEHNLK